MFGARYCRKLSPSGENAGAVRIAAPASIGTRAWHAPTCVQCVPCCILSAVIVVVGKLGVEICCE